MVLIQELPVASTQKPSHGWAYVPDIKPQLQPLQSRKRGARVPSSSGPVGAGGGGGGSGAPLAVTSSTAAASLSSSSSGAGRGIADFSAKEKKAIQARLNELDKENYKESHVPIPTKSKDRAGKKMSSNVRRILTYQRTFVHYLADEEAQLAQGGGTAGSAGMVPGSIASHSAHAPITQSLEKSKSARNSLSKQSSMQPPPRPSLPSSVSATRRARSASSLASPPSHPVSSPVPYQSTGSIDPSPLLPAAAPNQQTNQDPEEEKDPLLRTYPHLKPPSTRVLIQLLSEPALSYSASRAPALQDQQNNAVAGDGGKSQPSPTTPPPLQPKPLRHFCSMCGYWGKIRCKRCNERTCGLLDCYSSHDLTCPVPKIY